jgi:hypothetical protein
MTFPVINLKNANEMLKPVGVQITEHPLGYYEAQVGGRIHTNAKLSVLVADLMTTYFKPDMRQSIPLVEMPEVDPDYDEWLAASERRHTEAGIL